MTELDNAANYDFFYYLWQWNYFISLLQRYACSEGVCYDEVYQEIVVNLLPVRFLPATKT